MKRKFLLMVGVKIFGLEIIIKGLYPRSLISVIGGWFAFFFTEEFWKLNIVPTHEVRYLVYFLGISIVSLTALYILISDTIKYPLNPLRKLRKCISLYFLMLIFSFIIGFFLIFAIKRDFILSFDIFSGNKIVDLTLNKKNASNNNFKYIEFDKENKEDEKKEETKTEKILYKYFMFYDSYIKLGNILGIKKRVLIKWFPLFFMLLRGTLLSIFYGVFLNMFILKNLE